MRSIRLTWIGFNNNGIEGLPRLLFSVTFDKLDQKILLINCLNMALVANHTIGFSPTFPTEYSRLKLIMNTIPFVKITSRWRQESSGFCTRVFFSFINDLSIHKYVLCATHNPRMFADDPSIFFNEMIQFQLRPLLIYTLPYLQFGIFIIAH